MSLGKKSKANVAKVREQVFARDDETCVVAGSIWQTIQPCTGSLTIQHRVGRGAGGSALFDAPNSLLAMCFVHNGLAESSSEFAAYCTRNGLSVRRSIAGHTPLSRIPVKYADGWFLLDGLQKYPIPDNVAHELMSDIYGSED